MSQKQTEYDGNSYRSQPWKNSFPEGTSCTSHYSKGKKKRNPFIDSPFQGLDFKMIYLTISASHLHYSKGKYI